MFENLISAMVVKELPVVLTAVLPEFILLCLATVVLLIDAYLPRVATVQGEQNEDSFKNFRFTFWLVNIVLVITFILVLNQSYLNLGALKSSSVLNSLIGNMVVNDPLSNILKLFMILFVLFGFYLSDTYLKNNKIFSGEYYAMGLFSLLGMMVLVSSQNMLTLYLGLELFSLPVYAMISMQRKSSNAGEAALKYFVMGAIASGLLLFGISIIYGLTGSLVLSDIGSFSKLNSAPFILGLIFICVGIAFKFGAAPFHMWMPDVYQGAPTAATLFIATAPKLAAFGMAIRLLNEGLVGFSDSWSYILQIIGILSIAWGNIAAVAQSNLKRLLAYSGIGHMGFIILGLVSAASVGYSAGLFYSITYTLMSLAAFGFIMMLGNGKYELTDLEDYRGLYYKQPWLAFMLLILLFSMAGVPPFVGFFAKLSIIMSLVSSGNVITAVLAILFTVIGAFYYLRLIWLMFFEGNPNLSASNTSVTNIAMDQALANISSNNKFVVSISCLLVLALGIYSQWLLAWCIQVFK